VAEFFVMQSKFYWVLVLLGEPYFDYIVTLNVFDNFLPGYFEIQTYLKQLPCQIFDPVPL
jgi:hypothetical protein